MKQGKMQAVLSKIKNNPVLTIVTTVGALVIAVSSFTGAIKEIRLVISDISGTAAATDIEGRWLKLYEQKSIQHSRYSDIYFNFTIKENQLFGNYITNNEAKNIIDGKIIADEISFKLQKKIVTQNGYYKSTGGRNKIFVPPIFGYSAINFTGTIKDGIINLDYHDEQGEFGHHKLKKYIDLTKQSTTDNNQNKNSYSKLYSFTSHKGGVRSLAFGTSNDRYGSTKGLKLITGGATDGEMKFWDSKSAVLKRYYNSKRITKSDQEGGSVNLLVDNNELNVVRIMFLSNDQRNLSFSYYGDGWKKHTEKIIGTLKTMAISKDSKIMTTAIISTDSKSSISVYNIENTDKFNIQLDGIVTTTALNSTGVLTLVAQTLDKDTNNLKLLDSKTGQEKWSLNIDSSIDHLLFSPSDNIFAAANNNSNKIEIRDSASGEIKFTLPGTQGIGIASLSFNSSGKLLAAADLATGVIKLWDIEKKKLDHEILNPDPATALSFSYDDKLLAVGNINSDNVNVWGR